MAEGQNGLLFGLSSKSLAKERKYIPAGLQSKEEAGAPQSLN
jgi:hypothetical protein